ncbi:MAG: T9SS type A sorting domain-containing protein [Bacteroidia bacterium]|nr:T9SS type A sorting domain-containing protein [Bacteroidia bacterium]
MRKIYLSILMVALIAAISFFGTQINSGGKAGNTGSPGESTCGACHSGGTAALSGVSVVASPQFTNNQYIPGQTYTITIGAFAQGYNSYGFGCEILNASNNSNIGTMQNPGPGVHFLTAGNGRNNATQTAPKSGTPVTFSFQWVAPTSGTANIYVCVNAVNGNGGTSGDFVMTTSLSVSPANTSGIKENLPAENSFNVYPNPFEDFITVELNKESNITGAYVQIFDFTGKMVYESESKKSGFDNTIKIDMKDLPESIYTVKVLSDGKLLGSRLIFRKD